jgi:hypothetical protein
MDAKGPLAVPSHSFWKTVALGGAVLAVLLAVVFRKSFEPGQVVFSNDGPLGVISAQADNPTGGFSGFWQPLNWLGNQGPNSLPTLSQALFLVTGPIGFSKFYAPFAILVLGLAAVALFYRLGFPLFTSVLGGLAAAFSTDFFSYACWGLASLTLCMAFSFFALAAVSAGRSWLWAILGGLAVGMGIMEGFDSGAIMSLYIAAFVLFRALREGRADIKSSFIGGVLRVLVVALFAGLIAAQALSTLIGTQISGIAGAGQADANKEERWDWATQWSLPKAEVLRVFIPGLYGYRMDTPEGGSYWGTVGQQPGWETHHQGFVRYSGAGFYVGIFVLFFAVYGMVESFRKDSALTADQRGFVKFWAVAALISLLYAFGRHAPFYKIVYSLPYFSTIRNPVKFMHPFSLSMVVLFVYGLHGFLQRSRNSAPRTELALTAGIKEWWRSAKAPDKKWIWGCLVFTGLCLIGLMVFVSDTRELTAYLGKVQFTPAQASEIIRFTHKEIGWFFLFWILTLLVSVLFLAGRFNGARFRVGAALLASILIVDLVRANNPWIVHYDYRDKYASNPVIDFLKEKPYEHRVTAKFSPFSGPAGYVVSGQDQMNQIYLALCNEWLQHQFQFYKVQALDITQMPRVPELDKTFLEAFQAKTNSELHRFGRLWQLTNTRYVLGEAGFIDFLNQNLDPVGKRFSVLTRFDITTKASSSQPLRLEDFTTQISTNGRYAVFDFGGAVPRASLFSNWEVHDPQSTLRRLVDMNFNPLTTAIIDAPSNMQPGSTNHPGSVTITKYQPTSIQISAEVKSPSLLVLFDKYDPQWTVTVDGKKENLIRADYIFRGVFVSPGNHQIQFTFKTPLRGLYVSLASIAGGIILCLYLGIRPEERKR